MYVVGVICFLFMGMQTYAQADKKVKARIAYTEKKDKEKGTIVKKIDSREEFNSANQLIKEIEYDGDGKLKNYTVYVYENKKKISETEYSKDNKVKEKRVYTYNAAGVLIARTTYDKDNKVTKKRVYSYEYF